MTGPTASSMVTTMAAERMTRQHGLVPVSPRLADQPLVVVLLAVGGGMVLDRACGDRGLMVPVAAWWCAALASLVTWLVYFLRRQPVAAAGSLLLATAGLGGAWHHGCWNLVSPADLGLYARQPLRPVCVIVTALESPRRLPAPPHDALRVVRTGDRSQLVVRAEAIRDATEWLEAGGRATLIVDGHLAGIAAGDKLRVFGLLRRTVPARNPGEFDFGKYARGDRRWCVLRAGHPDGVAVVETASRWGLRRTMGAIRHAARGILQRRLSAEHRDLAAAVLLGAREQLGYARAAPFVTTGTVHLLVVSGLHLAIVAGGLFVALRVGWLPRKSAVFLVASLVVGYALLAHARPPVVRAAVLVVIICGARLGGWRTHAFNCLAGAAIVVIMVNPADLFRTGPQLSFLAVAALAWCAGRPSPPPDPLEQLIAESRPPLLRGIRHAGRWGTDLWLASAVVWLTVQPLVMARFHLITPVALLLGPLLWLPVAVGLFAGFVVLMVGWIVPPLGAASGWLCEGSLWLVEATVTAAHGIAGSHFWVTGPADWWLVGFYAGTLCLFATGRPGLPARWWVALMSVWLATGLFRSNYGHGRNAELRCTFLSMGHGCAVVLQLPQGGTVLYDSGSLGSPRSGARTIAGYLWSQGITRLDAVLLSHADVDHYNALPVLLDRVAVRTVLVSPVMFRQRAAAPRKLLRAIQDSGVPLRTVWSGDCIHAGDGVRIDVLHPPRRGIDGSDNANSLVLDVEYQGRHLLLPGDIEPPGSAWLVERRRRVCDVLMAPHHGSRHSLPARFAAWASPRWVVVSGAVADRVAEAEAVYRRGGAKVLRTALDGAVQFRIRGGAMTALTWWPPGPHAGQALRRQVRPRPDL